MKKIIVGLGAVAFVFGISLTPMHSPARAAWNNQCDSWQDAAEHYWSLGDQASVDTIESIMQDIGCFDA
jgi:hypothetical protein